MRRRSWRWLLAVVVPLLLAANCNGVVVTPEPPPEHRIGIRVVAGVGEFYDKDTGETFVPRGLNYNRWVLKEVVGYGYFALHDTLFNTKFNQLDRAEADLEQISASGYNVLRIWINACEVPVGGCIGDPNGGLDDGYMDNIVTFLEMAKSHGLYVMFTDNQIPEDGGYTVFELPWCCDTFNGYNLTYLTPGGHAANRAFFTDFVQGLIDGGAAMDAIFAFELRNEPFFETVLPPLTLDSGVIDTADGESYNLASADDRQRMMDRNMTLWMNEMAATIHDIDPTALTTVGFFHPLGPDADWLANAPAVVAGADLDFFAHHTYPDGDLTYWEDYAEAFTLDDYPQEKPLILGEFGAGKLTVPSLADAAMMLQRWQVASCDHGFGGWFLWTWGTGDVVMDDLWTAVDGNGEIDRALAPIHRPDPCAPGPEMLEHSTLSYHRPTTASDEEDPDTYGSKRAVDMSMHSWWTAPDGPPQWLEIDLETPTTVAGFRVPIGDVTPIGPTRIEVWGRGPGTGDTDELLHEFVADIAAGDVLEHTLASPKEGIRYVRFEVTEMQGWVILHELEVFGPEP